MLFYYCGISGELLKSHRVEDLANKLGEEIEMRSNDPIMQSVRRVSRYYLKTRYPNCQPYDVVPAEAFDTNEAEMAVDAASEMLEFVEENYLKE